MSAAFGKEGFVLAAIDEDNELTEEDVDIREEQVKDAKLNTASLAASAQEKIADLSALLGKLKTGTATRDEKKRLESLNSELSHLKSEISTSKTQESEAEVKLLRSKAASKINVIHKAMKEKSIRTAARAVSDAESVDLVFIVDITASMKDYIVVVKQNILDVVSTIQATNGSLKLRLAMVGYKGIKQSPSVCDFVSSSEKFQNFLGTLSLGGGDGDTADMATGVKLANSLKWEQATRVAFLIADVPCHGKEFHSRYDDYPKGTPHVDIKKELKRLFSANCSGTTTLTFCRLTHHTDPMIRRFKECGIEVDEARIDDATKVAVQITKSVRRSIFKTMTLTSTQTSVKSVSFAPVSNLKERLKSGGSKSRSSVRLKSYRILAQAPSNSEWKRLKHVSVNVYRNRSIKSVEDLQAPLRIGLLQNLPGSENSERPRRSDVTSKTTMVMRRARSPFAEGEIRLAYHARLARTKELLGDEKSAMVMKAFKHVGAGLNDRSQYLKQMEVSTIAHFLASEYNKSSYRPLHCGTIQVLQVCVVEEEHETNEKEGSRRFCAEEPLPTDGTPFLKFSNNTGHWDEDHLHETLLRFTNFSYNLTKGYLMVADLQGVIKEGHFWLTDPAILCKDILRFGNTNLGEEFMTKTIESTRAHMTQKGWH